MKKVTLLGLVLVVPMMSLAPEKGSEAVMSQGSDWTLVRDHNGITIHAREVANSRIKEFRGSIHIKTSLGALAALLRDVPSYPVWVEDCIASGVLEQVSLTERIIYVQTKVPLSRKRDAVVHSMISQDPKTGILTILLEGVPDFIPKKRRHVRVTELKGYWQFIPMENGFKRVVYQLYLTPGGRLNNLGFLVNPLLQNQLYRTLFNMRNIVKKARYQQARYFGPQQRGLKRGSPHDFVVTPPDHNHLSFLLGTGHFLGKSSGHLCPYRKCAMWHRESPSGSC